MAVSVSKAGAAVVVALACHLFWRGESAAAATGCFETGIDYFGNDVGMIRDGSVTTAEECQRRCQANPACGYFTFFVHNNHCYLKSNAALANRRPSGDKRISGPRSCGCFETGVDYFGHDVKDVASQTPMECQKLCQDLASCHYFTFYASTKRCYLKNADAKQDRLSDERTTVHVSGPKTCELTVEPEPEVQPEQSGSPEEPGVPESPESEAVPPESPESEAVPPESPESEAVPPESPEHPMPSPDAGNSEGGIEFVDQGIVKLTATRSPASFKVRLGSCYTVTVDKTTKEVHVEGSQSHKGVIPGEPVPNGPFVLLMFHDGNRLAGVFDYQTAGGDWASITVRTPSASCQMSQMTVEGVPSSEDFEGVRAFVTSNLKRLM